MVVFGHTGFKGSWLSIWLDSLGARVIGAAKGIPTQPSHYESAGMDGCIDSHTLDIRDADAVRRLIIDTQPDFVFHLAAQALVKKSYRQPIETFETNAMGTANILEALRELQKPCTAVLITSDKCYENVETYYGYRETDRLGGKDPYSASKAAAEAIIRSYVHSFYSQEASVRIGVTRAGNVIGGGDWAEDRLVPDIIRAWQNGEPVSIRNPASTRPWQHVLEPLSGYLLLGSELSRRDALHGEAFNFGPSSEDVHSVAEVTQLLRQQLSSAPKEVVSEGRIANEHHEAGLLKLCCDKAFHVLRWSPVLSFQETVRWTSEWYEMSGTKDKEDVMALSLAQINRYCEYATERGLGWVQKETST